MRRFLPFLLLVLAAHEMQAQSEDDALRFAFQLPGGTARSGALAGAFGAVGADPGCIGLNPGGLGLYTRTEVSLTPSLEVNTTTSDHYGQGATGTADRFFLNNFALVLSTPTERGSEWRYNTFGLVYDRNASHYWRREADAAPVNTSLLDYFADEAGGTFSGDLYSIFPFTAGLAWDTYGIDPADPTDSLGTSYIPSFPSGTDVRQEHTIESEGATKTTSFFYAANYADKLFIGASLGIVGIRYDRTTVHRETTLDQGLDLATFTYREDLSTRGTGVDLKLGAVVQAGSSARVGLAFHTPMWVNMNDAYRTEMSTSFRAGDGYTQSSPDGAFAYRLRTPWRLLGSFAYVFGERGLVSVDAEWTDHRAAKLRKSLDGFDSYDFEAENQAIRNVAANTLSVRAGTEWRSGNWYFRAGVGYHPGAYVDTDARSGDALMRYTGGFGFRTDHLSLDLAYQQSNSSGAYYQYAAYLVEPTTDKRTTSQALLTIAYRP